MSVKLKKRSKLFSESIDSLKADSLTELSPIVDNIQLLKKHIADLRSAEFDKGLLTALSESIDSLAASVDTHQDGLISGLEKLQKDYSWLKNKLSVLEDERKNFKILYELTSILDSEHELEEILQAVIDSIAKLLDAEYGIAELIDDDSNIIMTREASTNINDSLLVEFKDKVFEAAIDSGSSIVMNSLMLKENENGSRRKFGSVMCLPLKSDDAIIGTLYLGAYKKNFSVDETELLEALQERIGQAIANNIRFSKIAESRQAMLARLRAEYDFDEVVGTSPQVTTVLSIVADIADSNTAVLLEGESGTGKEVIARAIHKNSSRKNQPFIPINCSAIPETLLESELFGYEKGAFTGATGRKPGKFEQADGGTILLDEIGELPLALQVKLLRFLQSHEFEPLGSNRLVKSDVRIITATKRDLSKMVELEKFRDDLYYRINVINIKIPPLRERIGDIQALTSHFIDFYSEINNKSIKGITKEAVSLLNQFEFPGNVRELENVIERAVVLCKNSMLGIDDLPENVVSLIAPDTEHIPQNSHQLKMVKKQIMDESVSVLEKNFVIKALRRASGNVSEAARLTQMHRRQFQRLMQRCNLNMQDILS